MRQNPVWLAWKRVTAWYSSTPLDVVAVAMDRDTRRSVPWRYHIWFYAWIVALVALLPVEVVIAAVVGNRDGSDPQALLLAYGPFGVVLTIVAYTGVRHWMSLVPVPKTGAFHRASATPPSDSEPARRPSRAWRWLGPGLLLVAVLGRYFFSQH